MINFGEIKSIPQAKLYNILDRSLSRYTPKNVAVSMSPCLLANSFCADFYELYKQHLDEGDELIQNVVNRKAESEEDEMNQFERQKLISLKRLPISRSKYILHIYIS